MKNDACPDLETLQKLLLGDLPGPKCESLDKHLLNCDECTARAETISASDDVTEAIRTRRTFAGDEHVLAQVIERGKQLHSEASTVQSEETLAVDMRRHEEDAVDSPASPDTDDKGHEPIDFLQPAEQPDEIGRLGDYRVLEVLGVGGMGVVFRAEDPKLKRLVALKAMKPAVAASKSAKERFVREAQSTASIDHDNIVHIYQVGEDHNIPFIAMQFLRGESLQSRLNRDGQLDQLDVVRIGREVAAGLAAAHRRDLIHRDIKPDNIWIDEETGRAKILDFGLVRSVRDDAGLTQTGMVMGTPRYMAPEQAQGQEVDHRGDLFSLGTVLYHLASGNAPFEGGSLTAILIAVANKEAKPIQKVCPRLNTALAKLIMSLLDKDVDRRPQSAADVENALKKIEHALRPATTAGSTSVEPNETTNWQAPSRHASGPETKSRKQLVVYGALVAVALGVLFALWAASIILKIQTQDGTVVVEIDDSGKSFPVSVAEDKSVTIRDPNDGKQIKITIDRKRKQLRLEKEGFEIVTKGFSLESPNGGRVSVSFIPREATVAEAKSVEAKAADEASTAVTGSSDDPNVITVAHDGSAQCKTIMQALSRTKAGMKIRVIDDADYQESLVISSRTRHANVTLEAIRGATISVPPEALAALTINSVEGFAVRGFKLRLTKARTACCIVTGSTSKLVLDRVTFLGIGSQFAYGISIEGLGADQGASNVLIQDCVFKDFGLGVRVSGIANDYRTEMTCRRISLVDNRFSNNHQAITLAGDVRDVVIAGNQISESMETGVQLQNLVSGAKNIQVFNNTFFDCAHPVALWDTVARGENIRLLNNLTIESGAPDWIFIDNGGSAQQAKGPGDGPSVLEKWELAYNWREGEAPTADASKSRIPPAGKDVLKAQIDVVSRDHSSPDFLRPISNSPIATEGAGQDDPMLPPYVGARPPNGTQPWEWRRTWLAPPVTGKLITVSQNADDRGQFRTIADALNAAKPWSTIRVLDGTEYREPLHIDDKTQHRGIVLEAIKGAKIPELSISNVPDVVVRGFHLSTQRSNGFLVNVAGQVGGGSLESLEFQVPSKQTTGIIVSNVELAADQTPFVIQRCWFSGGQAISIRGSISRPTTGVVVQDNQLVDCAEGIEVQGAVTDGQIVGNTIQDCASAGIDLQNLDTESRRLLIANNTVFGCAVGLSIFDPEPFEELADGQVEIAGNLFFEAKLADLVYLQQFRQANSPIPVDGRRLVSMWRFHGNWRDESGAESSNALPLAENDHSQTAWNFASRKSGNRDYMRPTDADLAAGGAGGDLPPYAGATPPKDDVERWDWKAVWRSRRSQIADVTSKGTADE